MTALFIGIDHVGIAVSDMDAAIDFYERVLGMSRTHEEVNVEQGVREVMMAVSGRPGTAIQLLAPISDDSAIARFLANSGEGIQQIAYTVTDINAVSETLRGRGMTLLYSEPHRGTAGALINFVHPHDTGGVLIELVEPAP